MNKNSVLNEILNILIPEFLNNIDIDEQVFISNQFLIYFNDKYSSLDISELPEKAKEILINQIVNREFNNWKNATAEQKKSIIIKDESLQNLYILSHQAFSKAINRLNNNELISKKEANNLKKLLEETFNNIQEHNKNKAENELSEAMLDIDYASGIITNISSLRLGRERQLLTQIKK